jgi:hypothetical protein
VKVPDGVDSLDAAPLSCDVMRTDFPVASDDEPVRESA